VELEPASTWHPYRSEMSISRLAVPLCGKIFFVRVFARFGRQHLAKRKKRAASTRSTRKKRTPLKRAQLPNGGRLQNGARRPSDIPLLSAGQVPNVVARRRCGDRLLRVQVLQNADRPGKTARQIPQSSHRKRRRKRRRADLHHQKIPSPLTRLSRALEAFDNHRRPTVNFSWNISCLGQTRQVLTTLPAQRTQTHCNPARGTYFCCPIPTAHTVGTGTPYWVTGHGRMVANASARDGRWRSTCRSLAARM
jgi:hypothetical protein